MKHTPRVTFYLLCMFVLAQLIGVGVLNAYIDPIASAETGTTVMRQEMEVAGVEIQPPPVEETFSFIYIAFAILFGTGLVFLIMYFGQQRLWKAWFFLATLLTVSIALAAFIPSWTAFFVSLIIATIRVYRPHIIAHNLSELLTYGGLAAIFVPIMNLVSALGLLIFISLYDMYAVWHSKHMIKLAQYQTSTKLFAGLLLPYDEQGIVSSPSALGSLGKQTSTIPVSKKTVKKPSSIHTAILGGGDIGFPLFFIGVVLKLYGLVPALLIIPFVTAALALLFYHSEKGKFYPAMPFVSMGCLIGLRAVWFFL